MKTGMNLLLWTTDVTRGAAVATGYDTMSLVRPLIQLVPNTSFRGERENS